MITDQVRKNIFDQLCIDEGVKYEIYLDHLGYPTLGVGHLIKEGEPEHGLPVGTEVSEERVFELFEKDLDTAISECCALYGESEFRVFPNEVKEILVNMMFNLGRPRLSKFIKMNVALVGADWKTAAKEGRDSRWYRQVGNRAERLMSRLESV